MFCVLSVVEVEPEAFILRHILQFSDDIHGDYLGLCLEEVHNHLLGLYQNQEWLIVTQQDPRWSSSPLHSESSPPLMPLTAAAIGEFQTMVYLSIDRLYAVNSV